MRLLVRSILIAIVGTSAAKAAGAGTVYVSRDTTFVSALTSLDISIDGKVLGSVANGACLRLTIPAGKHVIGSPNFFGTVRESATINVPSGGHVYVTAVPKMEYPGPVHWASMVVTSKGRRC